MIKRVAGSSVTGNEKKRVLVVWTADYPWDVRIEKVSNSIIDAGYEVHLVCRNLKRRSKKEIVGGLNIHRLRALPGLANSVLSIPFFLNPMWLYKLCRIVSSNRIDLLIVRDLPMSPAGAIVASLFHIPCILDMAEVYPAMWRVPFEEKRARLGDYFLKNPKLAELIERMFLKKMSHVWVMVEESRQRLLDLGLVEDNVSIVGNTPKVNASLDYDKSKPVSAYGDINIIYTGVISPMRGLDTVIRAVKALKDEGVKIQLVVAGDGTNKQQLEELAIELGVDEEINMLGWIDHAQLPALLQNSHIGIVPHKVNDHTNTTVPNKLFDYMGFGLPVIVSNATPMERIVKECECGAVYEHQSVESLTRAITTLLDVTRRRQCGANGRRAYEEKYNWENDEAKLLQDVADVMR